MTPDCSDISDNRSEPRCGQIRIGISGWNYKPWRGVFYPAKLPHRRELAYAAGKFSSIEINGTFYSMKRPANFLRWAAETPDDFVFSIKGPRFITHMLKLNNAEQALANFLASGVLALGPKLGPLLWQLPPQFIFRAERLEAFFQLLPRDTEMAAHLAKAHHPRLADRVHTEAPPEPQRMRHAIEIRHSSFITPAFIDLLRRYEIALVCADTVEWPRLMDVTADFVYCRLHGSEILYASGYEHDAIDLWAERVVAWARGEEATGEHVVPFSSVEARPHDVYVYFDNDAKVRAPADAEALELRVRALLDEGPRAVNS